MKKRVWLYVNTPSGSEKMVLRQLNRLAGFALRKDFVITGFSLDSISKKYEFYNPDGVSNEILEAAANNKFDILLLTDTRQITPKNGWELLMRFNKLDEYGVQIFDLVIQDEPLQDTFSQFAERRFGYSIFTIKKNEVSGVYQLRHFDNPNIQLED